MQNEAHRNIENIQRRIQVLLYDSVIKNCVSTTHLVIILETVKLPSSTFCGHSFPGCWTVNISVEIPK